MNHERMTFGAVIAAAALSAAAFLSNGNAIAAAATMTAGAAWLAAWRRGSDALVDLGLAALLGAAAIGGAGGGATLAVLGAGATLFAWDAMRAERRRRPFTHGAGDAAARKQMRMAGLVIGGGTVIGLAALLLRALAPAGALSFAGLAALFAVSVALVTAAVRAARSQSPEQ